MTRASRFASLALLACLAWTVGCDKEIPVEDRALALVQQVTGILEAQADNPDQAAKEIRALTDTQQSLLKELRAVARREADGDDRKISEESEQKLQAAVNDLLKVAMTEKVMGHKELHEALKALFQ